MNRSLKSYQISVPFENITIKLGVTGKIHMGYTIAQKG